MAYDPEKLLAAVTDLIRPHLERSEPLRRLARELGDLLRDEASRAAAQPVPPAQADTAQTDPADSSDEGEAPIVHIAAELPLQIADATTHVTVRDTAYAIAQARVEPAERKEHQPSSAPHVPERVEVNLDTIIARCRIKAESCLLYIDRRAAAGDAEREGPLVSQVDALIARARAMQDCFLWMFWREQTQPPDDTLQLIAQCYEAMAAAVEVLQAVDALGDDARLDDVLEAFQCAAQANSALRVVLDDTWLTSPDKDQDEMHLWLKEQTTSRSIYVPRFMRLDDPASPQDADDLLDRIADLHQTVAAHSQRVKQILNEFGRIRYHVDQLEPDANADESIELHNCRKIHEAIETLDELGIPFSDPRFAELLPLPILDLLMFEQPAPPVQRVIDAVQRRGNANVTDGQQDGSASAPSWSDQVLQARSLLAGSVIVIIGGEPRNDASTRMIDAFDLDDAVWVTLQEHGSSLPMFAPIQRPETRLVLVLVKLAGHQHVRDAQDYAREAGKPVVLLPAGYNPEQIADAIFQQASERLQNSERATAGQL